MRILVFIRQVFDPRGIMVNRRAGKVFFNREEYVFDPAGRNALEAALLLKDADPAVEVVVMAAGPARVEDVLREALAMGADRAVRLVEAGADADGFVTARLLTAAARKLGTVDLVLAGDRALDLASGELGPRAAQELNSSCITGACALQVAGEAVHAAVPGPAGFVTVRAPLPAVVTVAHDANKPRYPHAPRLMREHRQGKIDYWDEAALDLAPAALAPRLVRGEAEAPPEQELGRVVDDMADVAGVLRPFVQGKAR
jgi:electron transfer flavoprotein beta subunit